MKRFILHFIYLFGSLTALAQKVDVLDRSSFRHNYVVGQFVYIEDAADTARLKYIATLQIHQENYPYIVTNFVDRFRAESKDLGANSFRVSAFEEKDSSVTLTIRIYFAPEKFFDLNEAKRVKGSIFIFRSERRLSFEQYFYLNDSLRTFPSLQYYRLQPGDKELVKIMAYKPKTAFGKNPHAYKFKADKDAEFKVVGSHLPEANGFIKTLAVVATAGIAGAAAGSAVPVMVPLPSANTNKGIAGLPYTYGRMLLDIYPLNKK